MRKYFYLLFFVFPVFLIAEKTTQEKEGYNFKQTVWGMTKQSVKNTEDKDPVQEKEDLLVYRDTILGLDVIAFYHFVENKLVRSGYGLMEEHSNENLYINDYEDLKKALIEKYGEPSDKWINGKDYNEVFWFDDLYKDDPSNWGFAISVGDLAYQLIWLTEETEIYLRLKGDNYKIHLSIAYISRELSILEEKKEKEEKLKNF